MTFGYQFYPTTIGELMVSINSIYIMKDTKPLADEAVNYVCHVLAKQNLRYVEPNYDTDGGDVFITHSVNRVTLKYLKAQIKGRNITSNNSNVRIHKEYVTSNFVLFLYLKVDEDDSDYLYCFFEKDVLEWQIKDEYYYLNIPSQTIKKNNFNDFRFDKSKVIIIKNLLTNLEIEHQNLNPSRDLRLIDDNINIWRLTGGLPDINLTKWLLKNVETNYTLLSHDLFLICIAFKHSNRLQTIAGVDYLFSNLKNQNLNQNLNYNIIEVLDNIRNDWLITYSRTTVEQLHVVKNGIRHNAFRLEFEDSEERLHAILFDDSEIDINYSPK